MMVQMMLQTAIFSNYMGVSSGLNAVTAFASLLIIFLGSFTAFVTMWRDTLLPPPTMSGQNEGDVSGLPPPQFGAAQQYGGNYGGEAGYAGGAAEGQAAAGVL